MLVAMGLPTLVTGQSVIPLELVNINPGAGSPGYPALPVYKYGIWVGLGGGAPKLYEFDTGGKGFWASYSSTLDSGVSQWWGDFTPTGGTLTNTYASGYSYLANVASTSVQIYASGTSSAPILSTSAPVNVAQITSATIPNQPAAYYSTQTNAGQPYLYAGFYGDFGAALLPKSQTGAALYSVLPQISTGADYNGFIVRSGGYANPNPTLQVGISSADNAGFGAQVQMAPDGGTFPNSGVATYAEQLFNAGTTWGTGSGAQSFTNIPVVIDTGAPVASIRQGPGFLVDVAYDSSLNYSDQGQDKTLTVFAPGTPLSLAAPAASGYGPLDAAFTTGDSIGADLFSIDAPSSGYINLGMNTFNNFDVMFNLSSGNVGFASIPEPSAVGLFALAAAAFLLFARFPGKTLNA
jgi:hypothetical protein